MTSPVPEPLLHERAELGAARLAAGTHGLQVRVEVDPEEV
jgi:hypothetical protein